MSASISEQSRITEQLAAAPLKKLLDGLRVKMYLDPVEPDSEYAYLFEGHTRPMMPDPFAHCTFTQIGTELNNRIPTLDLSSLETIDLSSLLPEYPILDKGYTTALIELAEALGRAKGNQAHLLSRASDVMEND